MFRVRASIGICAAILMLLSPVPSLASSATDDTIPLGTKITAANWQQYKPFMSDGMTALFEGTHFWHVPKDFVIDVGPTTPLPLPKAYLDATEKHSGQVTLERTAAGGYIPKNYVAGVPFPAPLKGGSALIGQRIFWDTYYRYQPRVQGGPQFIYAMDHFGSMTQTGYDIGVYSQMAHVVDAGYPAQIPNNPYYFAKYYTQLSPEQGKYLTILDLTPIDVMAVDEFYEYVPSLRRSLRLSEAARCSPILGTDGVVDDDNEGPPGLPQLYQVTYLGESKQLNLSNMTYAGVASTAYLPTSLSTQFYYPGAAGITPFPNEEAGKWEVRPVYVISISRLPQYSRGYCYGKKVIYVDKENYFPDQFDAYDQAGKLWKWETNWFHPSPIPGTNDVTPATIIDLMTYFANFQDEHLTFFVGVHGCLNQDCEKEGYLDVSRYASPEALMKIAQ